MTDTPAPTITCWHPSIHVLRNEEHDITVWACEDCRRRFYPACEQCVSIGHREGHGEHVEARAAEYARLITTDEGAEPPDAAWTDAMDGGMVAMPLDRPHRRGSGR